MGSRDKLKLDVLTALVAKPLTLFELATTVEYERASQLAKALDELVADGFLTVDVESSTAGRVYKHAREHVVSDLRARLLPHRDPVREAHEAEQTQGRSGRYRRVQHEGADLGEDD